MANIMRFVILGDDRGGPAFASFTRQVEKANQAVDRNNAALKRQSASSGKARGEVTGLGKAMGGLKLNPGLLGPAIALIPALGTLTGVAAGAGVALGGAFVAGGAALAGFGAVAKPVLSDAKKASEAVRKAQDAYTIAIAGGTKKSVAYKAEQLAIARAYAGMSPAQVALSRQLGGMASAWDKVKAAQTPVIAGALQPWLASVTSLTKQLGPIIANVAPVIGSLGAQFNAIVSSGAFAQFRDFIANTGSKAVGAAGNALLGLFQGFVIILPKFQPLIQKAVTWLGNLGPAIEKWASSQKTADHITAFMAWFNQNGHVVGDLLKNIAGALKAMAPGLTAGGTAELQVMSQFFGFIAELPPGLAKPLFSVAGAMLILNKLGVVKVGLKLIGMDAAKAAAGGGATGLWGKMLPGVRLAGGALVAVVAVDMILKNTRSGPGGKNWLDNPFGMPGPKDKASANNWLTSWSPYINRFKANITDLTGFVSGSWRKFTGFLSGSWSKTWAQITGSFDITRRQVAHIWDVTWNNTVGRAGRGVHDVAAWLGSLRAGAALAWDRIRGTAASVWNTIWVNTVTRTRNGVSSVMSWIGTLPGRITGVFRGAGGWLLQKGRDVIQGFWNGLTAIWAKVTTWIGGIASWIKAHKGPVSLDRSLLYPAGQALMGGLFNGLKAGFGPVGSFIGGIASWVAGKITGAGGKLLGGKVVLDTSQFSGGALAGAVGGGAARWKNQILTALAMLNQSPANLGAVEHRINQESGGNQFAVNKWDCLTLDAMILTRRGWLKHDEVQVGDETIGYNPVTGRSEWTTVTRVVHYADAPLVRLGGSRWHATTTPNHRWIDKPVTRDYGTLPDTCPYCPWPEPPPLRARLARCPECGWEPKAPGGVPLHRSLKHGIKEKKIERRVRRGKTTENGLAVHLGVAHGIKLDWQPTESCRFTETRHLNQHSRVLLSAPADTPAALDISVAEAALLGWLAGDGYIESPASRKQPAMSIAQSKPRTLAKLRSLLEADFTVVEADGQRTGARAHATRPHREVSEYIDIRKTRTGKDACGPRHQFRFTPAYTADLLGRVGHPKDDTESIVLRMSGPQRTAWLEGFVDAEGHRQGEHVTISQVYGPVLEAAHLAAYLCGYRPHQRDNKVTHPGWSASATISLGRPVVHGSFLRTTPAGRGDVWCVTTELGSWTARQDGHVFLTGNSNWARGTPSVGLAQVTGPTYRANSPRGWLNLPPMAYGVSEDVLANIYAGLHHAITAYPGRSLASVMLQPGGYALGTPSAAPGWAWVGERGPELMRFRGGEQVAPYAGGRGGGNTYQITVNVPPTASKADTGRVIVEHIRAYEQGSGKGWRRP